MSADPSDTITRPLFDRRTDPDAAWVELEHRIDAHAAQVHAELAVLFNKARRSLSQRRRRIREAAERKQSSTLTLTRREQASAARGSKFTYEKVPELKNVIGSTTFPYLTTLLRAQEAPGSLSSRADTPTDRARAPQ